MFQCKLLKMKFNTGSVCAHHTLDPCMPTHPAQPGCVMKVSRDHRLLKGKDNLVPIPTSHQPRVLKASLSTRLKTVPRAQEPASMSII